jgi:uncharacterized membrane protein
MVLGIIFGIATGIFAWKRGYNFFAWFLAGGLIGFIVLACLPDAHEVKTAMEPEEVLRLKRRGNIIGLLLALGSFVLGILIRAYEVHSAATQG